MSISGRRLRWPYQKDKTDTRNALYRQVSVQLVALFIWSSVMFRLSGTPDSTNFCILVPLLRERDQTLNQRTFIPIIAKLLEAILRERIKPIIMEKQICYNEDYLRALPNELFTHP